MKRTLFVLVLLVAGTLAFAQSEDDFEIIQKDGGITITGYTGTLTEIVIPARISGIAVYSIRRNAFSGKGLTKVTLPAGLRTIEEAAFSDNRLTAVVIPDTVTGIGNDAFSGNRIVELTLPKNLAILQGGAFAGNRIEALVIPAGSQRIGGGAFGRNPVKILDLGGVSYVSARAFEGSAAESVKIAANVEFVPMSGLDGSFVSFYNDNGKKAGTYVKNGRVWAMR